MNKNKILNLISFVATITGIVLLITGNYIEGLLTLIFGELVDMPKRDMTSLTNTDDNKSHCYCICGHEILQDPKSKIYEGGTFTNIICSKCGVQSTWDLDAPVPVLLSCIDTKEVEDE